MKFKEQAVRQTWACMFAQGNVYVSVLCNFLPLEDQNTEKVTKNTFQLNNAKRFTDFQGNLLFRTVAVIFVLKYCYFMKLAETPRSCLRNYSVFSAHKPFDRAKLYTNVV